MELVAHVMKGVKNKCYLSSNVLLRENLVFDKSYSNILKSYSNVKGMKGIIPD